MVAIAQKDEGQLAYPYGQTSTDEEILAAVLNALHHNTGVPQERVKVEVQRGKAVLTGEVDQEFERELAASVAAAAPGVVEVENAIKIAG